MVYFIRLIVSAATAGFFVFEFFLSGSLEALGGPYKGVWAGIFFIVFTAAVYLVSQKFIKKNTPDRRRAADAVFVGILAIFLFGSLIGVNVISDFSATEKRVLNRFPDKNPFHEEFPGQFNRYIDDRAGLKSEAFVLSSKIRPYTLERFNVKKRAIEGRDHWLFINEENDTIENFQAVKDFDDKKLAIFGLQVDSLHDFCGNNGIEFLFIMIPNKSSVYPEYYPSHIKRLPKPSSYERIIDYLKDNSKADIVDIWGVLMAAKSKYETLYYKADHHWNSVGGYLSYRELAQRIKNRFPDFKTVEYEDIFRCDAKKVDNDLVSLMGGSSFDYGPVNEFCVKNETSLNVVKGASPWQILGYVETANKKGLRMMIFHESFLYAMERFINEGASEILHVWFYNTSPLSYKRLILDYKPDIVIWEIQERYAVNFINDKFKSDERNDTMDYFKK